MSYVFVCMPKAITSCFCVLSVTSSGWQIRVEQAMNVVRVCSGVTSDTLGTHIEIEKNKKILTAHNGKLNYTKNLLCSLFFLCYEPLVRVPFKEINLDKAILLTVKGCMHMKDVLIVCIYVVF